MARLVPRESMPALVEKIDSFSLLLILQYLQKNGFILNDDNVTPATEAILSRLVELELVDSGFEGEITDKPSTWVSNGNGARALRYFEGPSVIERFLQGKLEISPRARIALSALSDWDRVKVFAAVDFIQQRPPADWGKGIALPLDADHQEYLLRASPELRVFIRVRGPKMLELFDVVRENTLQLFLERQKAASPLQ